MARNQSSSKEILKPDLSQKQIQADLAILEDYIQHLWRFLPFPTCYVNPIHHILDVNRAFLELTGYTDIEIIGKGVGAFFHNKRQIQSIQGGILQRDIFHSEAILKTKKKKNIPVRIYSQLRKDEEGNIIGYFLGLVDITQEKSFQKELQARVEERTRELREKVEELERFQKLTVGRELKMVELKKEIEKLKEELEKSKPA